MALFVCTTCSPSNALKASAVCLNKMAICYQTGLQREPTCILSSSPQARFGLGNPSESSAFADVEWSEQWWIRLCTIGEQLRAHRTQRKLHGMRIWASSSFLRQHDEAQIFFKSQPQICAIGADGRHSSGQAGSPRSLIAVRSARPPHPEGRHKAPYRN